MNSFKLFLVMVTLCVAVVSCSGKSDDRFRDMEFEAESMVNSMRAAVEEDYNGTTTTTDNVEEKVSSLQKILADLIERIRVRVEEKHQSAQDLLQKVREIVVKLNELHDRKGEKVRALLERLHGRVKELIQGVIDKITGRPRTRRSVQDGSSDEELIRQLQFDQLMLKAFLEDSSRQEHSRLRRSADNENVTTLEAIRAMFEKVMGHLLGRYQEFIEWLSTVWSKGIEQAKGHHERLVAIAKEVIQDAKDMHKETLREALEILRPYREELGGLWKELVDSVNKALRDN